MALVIAGGVTVFAASATAHADEAACAGTSYSSEGSGGFYSIFTPGVGVVPEPLGRFSYDCAVFQTDDPKSQEYVFVLVDLTDASYSDFMDTLKAFATVGWDLGSSPVSVDFSDGRGAVEIEYRTVDELEAIDPAPAILTLVALSQQGGRNAVSFRYVDGVTYFDDINTAGPQLEVSVFNDRNPLSLGGGATGIGDPSTLSELRTVAQAVPTPTEAALVAITAGLLTLLVGYPGFLLGRVLTARYDQLFEWTRRGAFARLSNAAAKPQPPWLIWPVLGGASVFAALIEPNFGFNPLTIRLVISLMAAFVIYNVVGWTLVRRGVARLVPGARATVQLKWGSLAILVGAVLVSRLLGFSPGIVFGVVAGLSFAVAIASTKEVIVVLVGSGFAVAAGLIGWVAYSVIAPLSQPGNVLAVGTTETFSAITIEGIATLPLALLPFANLDGGVIAKWNRWAWAGAYVIAGALFILVMLTVPSGVDTDSSDFVRWVSIFAVFGALAVAVWAIDLGLRRRRPASSTAAD